jgi:hypothetical protein
MRILALAIVPLVVALAGCVQTEGERLSDGVENLPGVASATPVADQGETTGLTLALEPGATLAEAQAAIARWQVDAGDAGSTFALTVDGDDGSFTATIPADDRLDDALADWWALRELGTVTTTDDYGDYRVRVYPRDDSAQLGPAAVADLAERVAAAAPVLAADQITVRSGSVGVDSSTGDFDTDVLRALDGPWRSAGAEAEVDLTASSVPVLTFITPSRDDAAYEQVLDAIPFDSGAVIRFQSHDATIATLRAGQCRHDGDASLWAYWGGPKACG